MTAQAQKLSRPDAIAVTWEDHRRTRELCDALGLQLHALTFDGGRWSRYLRLGTATLRLLASRRPRLVFVQNPSLVLALLVIVMRPFCGRYRILMDAHNEAVAPFTHTTWPIPIFSRLAIRAVDVTIVTNSALADQVRAIGGRPQVLPDRLPTAPFRAEPLPAQTPMEVMVVATYAADEPISEIIEAARQLGSGFRFRFTGRETRLPKEQRERLPANVLQTGFLDERAYWQLMADSHIVLDLTLKPNCLVCGAYEALAMMRPMILTGNDATVDLFGRVAVFPADSSSAKDIAEAVRASHGRYAELADKVRAEGRIFSERWNACGAELQRMVADYFAPAPTANRPNAVSDAARQ